MIPRYSRPDMVKIWEDKNKFKIWFLIEAYACEAMADLGIIPDEAVKDIWNKGNIEYDLNRIAEIEKEVKHDVIAFLTHLNEHVGENSRFIHQGMTSSDILDTCFSVQLSQSCDLLLKTVDLLLDNLKKKAIEHKYTLTMGRSHGIHAEPTTFGLKLAGFFAEWERNKKRLLQAKEEISTCAISGAVGTFANVSPFVEEYVAKKLNLKVEPVSTQVIPRDRHAVFFSILGVMGASLERLATEIRHLQRSEVLEVSEFFSKNQKGSSAMPHKKNPILTENITGLARVIRSYVNPALENIVLWHERDISHSSTERMIAPDATITLEFAINRMANVIDKLIVYPQNMTKNLNLYNGLHNSQRFLLALTQAGVSREKAYRIVQKNALKIWEEKTDFIEELKNDPVVCKYLTTEQINNTFDNNYHIKNVDYIFNRLNLS